MSPPRRYCTVDGCDERRVGRGYCEKHYRKFRRFGTPTPPESASGKGLRDEVERFWSKVDRSAGTDACWEWQSSRYQNGYGNYWSRVAGRKVLAHRYSYALHNGPIVDSLMVCHTCDNRSCVNPSHLWLGTGSDNQTDMQQKGRAPVPASIPEYCDSGHRLAEVGFWTLSGTVVCRQCHGDRMRREWRSGSRG